jgi:hypothetical protein
MAKSTQDKDQVLQVSGNETEDRQDVLLDRQKPGGLLHNLYITLSIFLLFLTFFVAQFDKFILSYFQDDVIKSLNLSSIDYGVLSGYATSM